MVTDSGDNQMQPETLESSDVKEGPMWDKIKGIGSKISSFADKHLNDPNYANLDDPKVQPVVGKDGYVTHYVKNGKVVHRVPPGRKTLSGAQSQRDWEARKAQRPASESSDELARIKSLSGL